MDIVRPGTYKAFKESLKNGRHYDMIHFDLHGVVKGSESKKQAYLIFDGQPVTGTEIGRLMKNAGVHIIALNACQSAFNLAPGAANANLARTFFREVEGLNTVIGMAYSVTVDAAVIFFRAFYQALLIKRTDLFDATHEGRLAIDNDPIRTAKLSCRVQLVDYIVPVLYQRQPINIRLFDATMPTDTYLGSVGQTSLLGRDEDILVIEKAILSSKPRILGIRGFTGVGKATLLRHLGWWWRTSNLVDTAFHIDFSQQGASDIDIWHHLYYQISLLRHGSTVSNSPAKQPEVLHFLESHTCVITLANVDSMLPRPPEGDSTGNTLPEIITSIVECNPHTLVLWSSAAAEGWEANLSSISEMHLHGLPLLDTSKLAAQALDLGRENQSPESMETNLNRIMRAVSCHPTAILAVLSPRDAQSDNSPLPLSRLLTEPIGLDWESDLLAQCRARFSEVSAVLGKFVAIFTPVQNKCSILYIEEQLKRNWRRLPWHEGSMMSHCPPETLDQVTRILLRTGIAQQDDSSTCDSPRTLIIHPLFCHYLRDLEVPFDVRELVYFNYSIHLHNRCVCWAKEGLFTEAIDKAIQSEWLGLITTLFYLSHPASVPADVLRCFDLPWVICSLMAHRRKVWQLGDDEELMTNISVQALQQLLPEYRPTDNVGWVALNNVFLKGRLNLMSKEDGLMALLLLQWQIVFYYDLNRDTARFINRNALLLLESVEITGMSEIKALDQNADPNRQSEDHLKRFIKSAHLIQETELGAIDYTWETNQYMLVWLALQNPQVHLSPRQDVLLHVWEQDLRWRLSGYEVNYKPRLNEFTKWGVDRLASIQLPSEERSQAIDDDLYTIRALKSKDVDDLERLLSPLLDALASASSTNDTRRMRHLLKCLFKIYSSLGDPLATVQLLGRFEAMEEGLKNKPGYIHCRFGERMAAKEAAEIGAGCSREMNQPEWVLKFEQKIEQLKQDIQEEWRPEDKAIEKLQQDRAVLEDQFRGCQNPTDTTDTRIGESSAFFLDMPISDVKVDPHDVEYYPEHEKEIIRMARGSREEAMTRRLPAHPQPPSDLYLSRSFVVASHWLTALGFLNLVLGIPEVTPVPTNRPETAFIRAVTPIDFYMLDEFEDGLDRRDDTKSKCTPPWLEYDTETNRKVIKVVRNWRHQQTRMVRERKALVRAARASKAGGNQKEIFKRFQRELDQAYIQEDE
jgi:hypothetical protein